MGAYVHPFRELWATAEQSGVRYRSNAIGEGASWENVRNLKAFDRALRLLCLHASETIDVGVRTKIAYLPGARKVF
ncbi:MAG: Abi family protein, partial [Actinomycetota bacterium]|nr:Abi family protein [Actinomycetota bacterium]